MIKILTSSSDVQGFDISKFYRLYVSDMSNSYKLVAIASSYEEIKDAQEMFSDLRRGMYKVEVPFKDQN